MAEAKIIIDDEPSTEFMMDGSELGVRSTQHYPDNADLSQLAPVLLIPTPQTNPSLPPKSVSPTLFGEHQIPLPSVSCEALAQPPTKASICLPVLGSSGSLINGFELLIKLLVLLTLSFKLLKLISFPFP